MAKAPRKYSIADVLGFGAAAPRSLASGLQREYRRMPRNAPIQGGIKATKPTATQELVQLLTPNTRVGNEFANKLAPAVDMSPIGVLTGLVDARRAYQAGNTGQAAGLGILAALGAIPGGKAASKAGKEAIETAAERGIIAYHGSPHSFDKFALDKIGSGEGAQAYGHGLYFAEAEDVAKRYRDNLSGRVNSKANRLLGQNLDIDAAILTAKNEIDRLKSLPNKGGDERRLNSLIKIQDDAIKELEARKLGGGVGKGSMYQVRINANPEDFIDWDALLSEQSPRVKQVFGESDILAAADRLSLAARNPMFAGDLIKSDKATPAELSQALSSMGIPGIKYKDAASRGTENVTRNYVVFDDALIDILKKYGIAIPAIAGGGLLATQPQQNGGI